MPRNGSGTYTLPQSPFVAGTVISSAAVNSDFSDIATALSGSLPRDGQAGMSGQFLAADGSAVAPSMAFNNEKDTGFLRVSPGVIGVSILGVQVATITASGVSGILPAGVMVGYGGSVAPTLWLLCFGQAVSRTTYAALFAAIGTTFGSGDGVTTFNIPDGRGVTLVGKDDMGGSASGRITSTFYGSAVTTVGSHGGAQSRALSTTNMAPYTPAGSVGISDPTHTHSVNQISFWRVDSGGGGVGGGGAFGTPGPTTLSIAAAATGISAGFSGSAQGGASTAFSDIQPSIILNTIIYAGA